MKQRIQAINIDPELMGGTPVFRGTRVPIKSLFDWLDSHSLEDFLENFPSVKRESALEVLAYVAIRLPEEQLELEKPLVELQKSSEDIIYRLVPFFNSWQSKANRYKEKSPASIFDKYFTLYVVYNVLYTQVLQELIVQRKSHGTSDYQMAVKNVRIHLGSKTILECVASFEEEIKEIHGYIVKGEYHIVLGHGNRLIDEDKKLAEKLISTDSDKKAKGILELLYKVRCNIFHGHKGLDEHQSKLVVKLNPILTAINNLLYSTIISESKIDLKK